MTPLKYELAAPTSESPNYVEKLVLLQNSSGKTYSWWGDLKGTRSTFDFMQDRDGKRDPFLNSKQILFTFHVNATYLYFADPLMGKDMLIDPLISFTSDLTQSMVFAVGDPQAQAAHKEGELIVISVPRAKLSGLCKGDLIPGEVWKTQDCAEFLNAHDDENEYDVLGYVNPNHIREVFKVNWAEFAREMQQR